ncbi:hypothetical protein [Ekhidna sp.]|uniref:hypothetical protein n=1 Tax=Ekhidna sp. TaxID=2608089 RepID=UPI0035180915
MRTIRRTIFSLGLAILIVGSTLGQGIDQERMDRDLKIAENILGTLSNDRNLFSGRNIESNYVPDYGVIFSMPQSSIVFASGKAESVSVVSSGSGYSYVVADSPSSDDREREVAKKASAEEQSKGYEEKVKEQMTLFLVDYADLIGQLKPTDRIMVNLKKSRNYVWVSGEKVEDKNMGMTAEILKGDLIAYKSGKASREQTISKIKFTEVNDKMEKDLELFSSIFSRLYEPDMSNTYYASSRNINYERMDNLGAIFSMRVYSSSSDNNGLHTIRTTGEGGLTQEERNEKVNAMYPDFETSLRQNVVDYGRTIKSLKPSELLIIRVRLTECKGCEMPKSIELSVKASVLSDFDSGKISRDKAMEAISIKKESN